MARIKFDFSRVMKQVVGEHGFDESALEALAPRAAEAVRAVQGSRGKGMLEFMELPHDRSALEACKAAWAKHGEGIEDVVVLGIGGSALGMTTLATALLSPVHNASAEARGGRPRVWVFDNIDPDWVAAHLDFLNPRTTLFNVITKSGTTAETMSQFLLIRRMIEDALGADYRKRLVCTTDPAKGKLRKIADDEGLTTLPIGAGVGGRWSVLSAVGLFPAVAVGIDCEALLEGAREMDERTRGEDLWKNPSLFQAALLYLAHERGMNMHVMMPYSQALRDFADWYRQLLAESLGKKVDRQGRVVNAGLTPVKALGVTDQHSQTQLYVEGPYDKLTTIIGVEKSMRKVEIPSVYEGVEGVSYLGGRSLAELFAAERQGSEFAYVEAGRPVGLVSVPEVNARAVGELFSWAEMSVAYCGELLDMNAFDQPGVEAGKNAAYALMGLAGYEDIAKRIRSAPKPGERYLM